MDVAVSSSALEDVQADVLVLAVSEPVELEHLDGLDGRLGGRLERLLADGELTAKRGKLTTLHLDGEIAAKRLTIAGLGKNPDADALSTAAAAVARGKAKTVAWRVDSPEQARAVADGLVLGRYDAGRWKTEAEKSPAARDAHAVRTRAPRPRSRERSEPRSSRVGKTARATS